MVSVASVGRQESEKPVGNKHLGWCGKDVVSMEHICMDLETMVDGKAVQNC